jgi:hypothetical protein
LRAKRSNPELRTSTLDWFGAVRLAMTGLQLPIQLSNSHEGMRSQPRGTFMPESSKRTALEIMRAQGRPGTGRTHGPPANKKLAAVTTGLAEHPAFPAQGKIIMRVEL